MKTILEQLYDSGWCEEMVSVPKLAGHEQARKEALAAYVNLNDRICDELREHFEDFITKDISTTAFSETEAFMQGFVMASRLYREVYE